MSDTLDLESLFQRGVACANEGRMREAESAFREALAAVQGGGSAEEARACGNLGSLFLLDGRRHEALMLYRRALRIDEALGAERRVVKHVANVCSVYVALSVWALAEDALRQLDESLQDASEDLRQEAHDLTLWPRAYCALTAGELTEARALLTELRTTYTDRTDPATVGSLAEFECDLLLAEGKPEAALAVAGAMRPVGEGADLDELDLLSRRLECLRVLGRASEHAALAHEVAGRLSAISGSVPPTDFAIDVACDIARHLACYDDLLSSAREAYDAAATVLLHRLRDLEDCWTGPSPLGAPGAEDLALTRRLRAAYEEHRRELMHAVVDVIKRERDAGSAFLFRDAQKGILLLCAWCGRVRSRSGGWLPIPLNLPYHAELRATHGICAACHAALPPTDWLAQS